MHSTPYELIDPVNINNEEDEEEHDLKKCINNRFQQALFKGGLFLKSFAKIAKSEGPSLIKQLKPKQELVENDKHEVFVKEEPRTEKPLAKKRYKEKAMYYCEVCSDQKKITRSELKEHLVSHGMPDAVNCSETFKKARAKQSRVTRRGGPVVKKCEVCEKEFAHKKSLVLHIRSHTGENTVLCDMCGKCLTSTQHLKQHLRIHTGYKPHVCAVCGKGFAKNGNLTLHERVHSGEKPYICRNCGKSFSQRSTLVIHERYHSGERPYTCRLCNKGFVAKGLLGVHLKSCSRIP